MRINQPFDNGDEYNPAHAAPCRECIKRSDRTLLLPPADYRDRQRRIARARGRKLSRRASIS